jgi:hypothetical protein
VIVLKYKTIITLTKGSYVYNVHFTAQYFEETAVRGASVAPTTKVGDDVDIVDGINFKKYQSRDDSAYNRNEYQESSWGVKGGRRVGLTTLPLSVSRLSE